MRSKFNFLALMKNILCGRKLTLHIDRSTPFPLQKMMMTAACYGEGFSLAVTGKLVRTDGKMDEFKYRTILGNSSYSLQTTLDWRVEVSNKGYT